MGHGAWLKISLGFLKILLKNFMTHKKVTTYKVSDVIDKEMQRSISKCLISKIVRVRKSWMVFFCSEVSWHQFNFQLLSFIHSVWILSTVNNSKNIFKYQKCLINFQQVSQLNFPFIKKLHSQFSKKNCRKTRLKTVHG